MRFFTQVISIVIVFCCSTSYGQIDFIDKQFGVSVTSDIIYDTVNTNLLTLDLYEPTGTGVPTDKPMLILTHGGAWILGDKLDSTFESAPSSGDFNTPMSEYAIEFTKRGYVVVSINYRKALDGFPFMGTGALAALVLTGVTPGLNALAGFPILATTQQGIDLLEMAEEDIDNAIAWAHSSAGALGVDTSRIALGGYSAGATSSLQTTYATSAPVAAIWVNSGSMWGSANAALGITGAVSVPTIMFHGDSDGIVAPVEALAVQTELNANGIPNEFYLMPGENHYYLRSKIVSVSPAPAPTALEDLVATFFYTQMNLSALNAAPVPVSNPISMLFTILGIIVASLFTIRIRLPKS